MVRDEDMRTKMYAAKVDGNVAKLRTDAMKKQQAQNYGAVVAKQSRTRNEVVQIVAGRTSGWDLVNYLGFANELLRVMRTHTGEIVCSEIDILQEKHAARGQNAQILLDIINYYAPACAFVGIFTLDVSALDGPDVLA